MNKAVFLIGTRWFGVLGPCRMIIDQLIEKGYTVYVIGQKDEHYKQFMRNDVELIEVAFSRKYFSPISDLKDLYKLARLALKVKPEIVHSFNPKPSFFSYFISLIAGTKFFVGVTGLGNTFINDTWVTKTVRSIMPLFYNRANCVFFQNDDDLDYFKRNILSPKVKTKKFTSPGVDIDRFQLKEESVNQSEPLRVLLVARLLWQKGVDDFIEAAKYLHQTGDNSRFKFTLVGPRDEQHPDRLEDKDFELFHKYDIEWLEWTSSIEDVYKENDVLLFMSHREGGPRAILEASASGLPTVGANATGVRTLISHEETGYIVEQHDIEAIVRHLKEYDEDRSLLRQHGVNARKVIAERFSLEKASKAQLEMYEEC